MIKNSNSNNRTYVSRYQVIIFHELGQLIWTITILILIFLKKIFYFFRSTKRFVLLTKKKKKMKNFEKIHFVLIWPGITSQSTVSLSVTSVWRAIVHPFSPKLWLNVAKTCSLPRGRYFSSWSSSFWHVDFWDVSSYPSNFLVLTISHRSFRRNDFRVYNWENQIWRWRWRRSQ